MTSLTAIMRSGLSGLNAAQTGLSVASQNIANANTPGYVRAQVTLAPRTELGAGAGVEVAGIRRAADRFLATASYIAEAARGSAAVRSNILERAQLSFGDPSSATSVFASLDDFWSALAQVGVDPSSTLRRADVVNSLQRMFGDVQRIGGELQALVAEADQRIADSVSEAQSLIERITELNTEIRLNARAGADATAAENAQSAMIDRLATLMDVRVSASPEGGVQIRTTGGALLVGIGAAQLAYTPSSGAFATPGVIRINEQLGTQSNLEPQLLGGEIKGLIEVRDRDLAGLAEALGGFSAALADALNQVHNENASSPAVSQMIGRQTGLLATDEIGFTGNAIVGLVDASGALGQRLTIDFDAQTITAEAPAGVFSFAGGTIANFVTALNGALGAGSPAGAATFSNGVLSLNVGNNGGLVIQQDAADPSARAGRGFSHFFGLNDIVSRPTPLFFESGAAITDAHGLSAGGAITYQVRDSGGRFIAERSITISGALVGGTWNDLVSELNAVNTGLGQFGAFTFDGATGRINFAADPAFQVSLTSDTTQRGGTGVSFTALHGLSKAATAGRALDIDINGALAADSARLAVARPNLGVAIGERAIEGGDNRGASALLAARNSVRAFPAAGVLGAQSTTLATYAARLGGEAGRLASDGEREEKGAVAVANAAGDRRAQIEGVSLDDELMKMTVYQNAYAAAARVVQAAQDMLDVLLALGR
jgi:flagellar hook-associated protein 1 FlgK